MTQDPVQHLHVEPIAGVTVVTVTGTRISAATRAALYALAADLVHQPPPRRVVVDLAEVQYLTSEAIGILITFQKNVREAGGVVKICGADPHLRELFRLTRVDQLIEVRSSRREAIAAFAGRPSLLARLFGGR